MARSGWYPGRAGVPLLILSDERDSRERIDLPPRWGNFGDLWSDHWPNIHSSCEAVLYYFHGRSVLQLPQSIHFSSEFRADHTARLIEAHKSFTLLVRDQESLDFAWRKFSCHAQLCPDMAFALGPLSRSRPPSKGALFLLRTDKERGPEIGELVNSNKFEVIDWIEEPAILQYKADWPPLWSYHACYEGFKGRKMRVTRHFDHVPSRHAPGLLKIDACNASLTLHGNYADADSACNPSPDYVMIPMRPPSATNRHNLRPAFASHALRRRPLVSRHFVQPFLLCNCPRRLHKSARRNSIVGAPKFNCSHCIRNSQLCLRLSRERLQ